MRKQLAFAAALLFACSAFAQDTALLITKPDADGIVATGKVLKVANSGTNTVTVDVYFGGTR